MTVKAKTLDLLGPYPAYKDSGVEWIGEIPENWEVRRLKELTSQKLTNGVGEPGEHDNPLWARYIRITDILNDRALKADTFRSLPPEIAQKADVQRGDILMAAVGASYGKSYLHLEEGNFCYAGFLVRYRPDLDKVVPKYMGYWTQSGGYWHQLRSQVIQATIQNFSASKYAELLVPTPSRAEQTTIAAFLDHETARIDALVREQELLLEDLAEKRRATVDAAVTGQLLNPDSPHSRVKDIGDIPTHWEVVKLKRVAQVRGGVTKGRDLQGKHVIDVAYLRVANVQDGYLNLEDVATIEIGSDELERYSLKAGDVLMNEGGDNDKLGRGAVWHGQISPCVHQNHVFSVRPYGVDSDWLALINTSSYAKFYFFSNSKQSTNLASISSSNIKELPVIIPPPEETRGILNAVRERLAQIDELAAAVRANIEDMQLLRSTLITAATTGKIDVRFWKPT